MSGLIAAPIVDESAPLLSSSLSPLPARVAASVHPSRDPLRSVYTLPRWLLILLVSYCLLATLLLLCLCATWMDSQPLQQPQTHTQTHTQPSITATSTTTTQPLHHAVVFSNWTKWAYEPTAPPLHPWQVCRRREQIDQCVIPSWRTEEKKKDQPSFPFGRINCDPPLSLIQSTAQFVAAQILRDTASSSSSSSSSSSPSATAAAAAALESVLLIPGDFVAHFSPCQSITSHVIDEVLTILRQEWRKVVTPDSQAQLRILPAIGNTDLFPTYYLPYQHQPPKSVSDLKKQRTSASSASSSPASSPLTSSSPSGSEVSYYINYTLANGEMILCHVSFFQLMQIYVKHDIFQNDWIAQKNFCFGGYYATHFSMKSQMHEQPSSTQQDVPSESFIDPTHIPSSDRLTILTLNTILYSPDVVNHPALFFSLNYSTVVTTLPPPTPCSQRDPDPFQQFQWLEEQLLKASKYGYKVVLQAHIPWGSKDGVNAFCPQYERKMNAIVQKYHANILAGMFGDFSYDLTRFIFADKDSTPASNQITNASSSQTAIIPDQVLFPVFIQPGVSIRKHCNPAVRRYDFDLMVNQKPNYHVPHTVVLRDYTQFYLSMYHANAYQNLKLPVQPLWKKQYSLLETFGLQEQGHAFFDQSAAQTLYEKLLFDEDAILKYMQYVDVNQMTDQSYMDWMCDLRFTDMEENKKCRNTGNLLPPRSLLEKTEL